MHTFNREYSQVSSSASESKVSPSLGPVASPVNLAHSEPNVYSIFNIQNTFLFPEGNCLALLQLLS